MRLKLVEDFYDKLDPKLQQAVDDNSDVREQVKQDKVTEDLINLITTEDGFKSIIESDVDLDDKIKHALFNAYFAFHRLPLGKDESTFLLAKVSKDDPRAVFEGNSPFFEFIKNMRDTKLDYDTLLVIEDLNKKNRITNQDLKLSNSWITDKNIYKEDKVSDINYLIKLKVFLDDPDNIEKFKDNAGNPLPADLRDWEQAVKQPAAKLKAEYSKYTSDAANDKEAKENIGKITLEEFLNNLYKKTEHAQDKWTADNSSDKILKLIKASADFDDKTKQTLANNFNQLRRDKQMYRLLKQKIDAKLDILGNKQHIKTFINWLIDFFKATTDLANKLEKGAPLQRLKAEPGKQYSFKDALRILGIGEGNIAKKSIHKLFKTKSEQDQMTNYTSQLKKIVADDKARNLLFNAPIRANKNGGFNIVSFLRDYIENADIPAVKDT